MSQSYNNTSKCLHDTSWEVPFPAQLTTVQWLISSIFKAIQRGNGWLRGLVWYVKGYPSYLELGLDLSSFPPCQDLDVTRYLHWKTKSILIPVEYLVAACRSKHTIGTLCNRELFRVGGEVAEVAMRCFSEHNLSVMKWGGGPAKMGHLRHFPIQMALSSQRPPLKLKSPSLNLRVLISLPPILASSWEKGNACSISLATT